MKDCATKAFVCSALITMSGCFSMLESSLGKIDGGSGRIHPSTVVIDAVTLPAQVVFFTGLSLIMALKVFLPKMAVASGQSKAEKSNKPVKWVHSYFIGNSLFDTRKLYEELVKQIGSTKTKEEQANE